MRERPASAPPRAAWKRWKRWGPVAGALALAAAVAACGDSVETDSPAPVAALVDEPLEPDFERLPERVRHVPTGIVLVRVPAGSYLMGSPYDEAKRDNDEGQIEVTVERDFYLGETEVTVAQWERVMGPDPDEPERDGQLPIGDVSWYRAQEFVERLNALGSGGWRLPAEIEWEYACRAGTRSPFSFGEDVTTDQVDFDGSYPYLSKERGRKSTGPVRVRSLPPNPWGLYEMHGNVFEWCEDVYATQAGLEPPTDPPQGVARVLRGGSWFSSADQVRSAFRDGYSPNSGGDEYGLRVARTIPR